MKPEVMTSMVEMTVTAQVHLLKRMGATMRAARASTAMKDMTEKRSPQSKGTRYGMGTGVKLERWSASSFAPFPLGEIYGDEKVVGVGVDENLTYKLLKS